MARKPVVGPLVERVLSRAGKRGLTTEDLARKLKGLASEPRIRECLRRLDALGRLTKRHEYDTSGSQPVGRYRYFYAKPEPKVVQAGKLIAVRDSPLWNPDPGELAQYGATVVSAAPNHRLLVFENARKALEAFNRMGNDGVLDADSIPASAIWESVENRRMAGALND